jgi:hypothetical protein
MTNIKIARFIVRFASLYNASALFVFLIPGGLTLFGVEQPYSFFWQVLPALLASFAAIVLFFSSNNLQRFATFPYWNGIVRIVFAVTALLLDFKTSVGYPSEQLHQGFITRKQHVQFRHLSVFYHIKCFL